jgi:ATP-dependent Clp protease ATP-binding subunit ClpA
MMNGWSVPTNQAVEAAQRRAEQEGLKKPRPKHLLASILEQRCNDGISCLKSNQIPIDHLQAQLAMEMERDQTEETTTIDAVLDRAEEQRIASGSFYVTTRHVLAALGERADGITRRVLEAFIPTSCIAPAA